MNKSLNILLSGLFADESDYVLIEQEPWAKDVGRTSKNQGVLAIGSMIFGGSLPLPNCGSLAGFDAPVYVYPSRSGLYYRFDVAGGEFVPGIFETVLREEIVQCSLKKSADTDYPVLAMRSMEWIGHCYDGHGNVVGRPSITRSGRTIFLGSKVYGSIRVKYFVERMIYNVRVEERDESIENNFDCVAFCVWPGGVKFKEIEAPGGYEETRGNCGNGIYNGRGPGADGDVEICQPDWGQGTYPVAVRADRHTKKDYCSQVEMSDTITESVETENMPGEECSDGPITTN